MIDNNKIDRIVHFITGHGDWPPLTHTKGKWANQPFKILDWQLDKIIKPLFGTIGDNGFRQYKTCYLEIPKKNGKTELGAAVGLYMLCADQEFSPEVYSAAADKEQAGLIYFVAAQMVRNHPVLNKILKVRDSRKRIINPKNDGFYQVLSSDVKTKHGLNPTCVLFDELHAQPNDELWRVLTSGTDYARDQQLIFVMTTAGIYDQESIWWRIRNKAIQIDKGIMDDNTFLPILYIADPENYDPEDEELWKRVNPSLDRIFTLDKIRKDFNTAKNDPVEYADFLRFRLNIPIKQFNKWLPMGAWDKCNGEFVEERYLGKPCYAGYDASSTQDLTSLVLFFPPLDDYPYWQIKSYFYCPMYTVNEKTKKDAVHYDLWVKQGYITTTPGNSVDYSFVKKDILDASKKYDLREVGYDPWNTSQVANELYNDENIPMVDMRQGVKTLSEPSKTLLKMILNDKIRNDSNPVMRWCADNVVVISDANENIRPVKDKSTGRIDGIVALIEAVGRALFCENINSVYDDRELVVF